MDGPVLDGYLVRVFPDPLDESVLQHDRSLIQRVLRLTKRFGRSGGQTGRNRL